jgi:hypothetical protein
MVVGVTGAMWLHYRARTLEYARVADGMWATCDTRAEAVRGSMELHESNMNLLAHLLEADAFSRFNASTVASAALFQSRFDIVRQYSLSSRMSLPSLSAHSFIPKVPHRGR